jgi:hypothetical protein
MPDVRDPRYRLKWACGLNARQPAGHHRVLRLVDRATAIAMIQVSRHAGGGSGLRSILTRHRDEHVRIHLAGLTAPGRYQDILARDPRRSVRSALARSSGPVRSTALVELALDEESGVRGALADREALPAVVWNLLVRDSSVPVRLRLARNPNAPANVVRALCADPSARVRKVAVRHPRASAAGMVEAALRGEDERPA